MNSRAAPRARLPAPLPRPDWRRCARPDRSLDLSEDERADEVTAVLSRGYAPGTYTFWRCRLRVTVRGDGLRFVRIQRLVVARREFNRKEEGQVVVGPEDPVVVVFPESFQNVPRVTAHLLGYPGSVEIVAVTPTQVTLRPGAAMFAEDPATFAPAIHWQAMAT